MQSDHQKQDFSTKDIEDGLEKLKIGRSSLDWMIQRGYNITDVFDRIISRRRQLRGCSVSTTIAMNYPMPKGQFLTAYVAALIDENRAILMIPDNGGKVMIVRMTQETAAGDSENYIDYSTLFLTQEVKVYGVVPTTETVADLPTWSKARWISTKIMPFGPLPETIETIGIASRGDKKCMVRIFSDETPQGFLVRRELLQKHIDDTPRSLTLGSMFTAYSYQLREGTTINNLSDVNFYISNPEKEEFNSGVSVLRQIFRATPWQMEMCRSKCHSSRHTYIEDYEFYIGKGSLSMAAFESYIRNAGNNRYIFKISSKIRMEPSGLFTTSFSIPCRSWDEGMSDVWAAGMTTMAVFRGTKSYRTPVQITSFAKQLSRGYATVQFSRSASDFLMSWLKLARSKESVIYGPVNNSDDYAYDAIKDGFSNLMNSDIFDQYVAAEKPMKPTQKLTEKQKIVGEFKLDEFQASAMETILYSDGISLTQAPPGSGKTVLVAAVTRELLLGNEAETILITGTTNIAVDNALSTLIGIAGDLKNFRPVRIASQRAMCYSKDIEKKWTQHEKAMRFENHISSEHARIDLGGLRKEALKKKEIARGPAETVEDVINKYVDMKNAETVLDETFTEYFGPNLIATTTSLLLRNCEKKAFEKVTHIIIDEASQLIPTELLAILSAFPKLKKLAIIGDEFQLQPYSELAEDSDARICFGTSDLIRLNKQFGGTATKLGRIYRSHPKMTKNLINSFYPYELEAGAKAEDRTMAERLQLPTCDDGTPVRAYHVDGEEKRGKNEKEASAIVHLARNLVGKGVRPGEILVLTFHCNQRSHLCTILPRGVRVKTIDSAQGQQSPITIVATTKICKSDDVVSVLKTMQFVSNKNRGTVALSRGLQATYIFGNLKQLVMTPFWGPVIKKLRSLRGTSTVTFVEKNREGTVESKEESPPSRLPSSIKPGLPLAKSNASAGMISQPRSFA